MNKGIPVIHPIELLPWTYLGFPSEELILNLYTNPIVWTNYTSLCCRTCKKTRFETFTLFFLHGVIINDRVFIFIAMSAIKCVLKDYLQNINEHTVQNSLYLLRNNAIASAYFYVHYIHFTFCKLFHWYGLIALRTSLQWVWYNNQGGLHC